MVPQSKHRFRESLATLRPQRVNQRTNSGLSRTEDDLPFAGRLLLGDTGLDLAAFGHECFGQRLSSVPLYAVIMFTLDMTLRGDYIQFA